MKLRIASNTYYFCVDQQKPVSIIIIPLQFEADLADKVLYTTIDSIFTYSCFNPEMAEGLDTKIKFKHSMLFATASEENYMEVKEACK